MGYKTGLSALTLALALSSTASAECYMRQATGIKGAAEFQRVDVINQMVVPNAQETKTCSVMFKAQVNGQWLTGYGSHDFSEGESEAVGCQIALEKGKHELALTQEGKISSETSMVCSDEPGLGYKPTAIGDLLRESQVQPDPRRPDVFNHQGTVCKRYIETALDERNSLYQYHGVICQLAKDTWVVTDKW